MEARREIDVKGIPWIIPLMLAIFLLVWLFWPFNFFVVPLRKWILRSLGRILLAPFFSVRFVDVWVADQLTSMGDFLFQLQFVFCMYPIQFSEKLDQFCLQNVSLGIPILNLLPNWCRLLQCLRKFAETRGKLQLVNAGKYTAAILSIVLAFVERQVPPSSKIAWRIVWFIVTFISTLYSYFFDLIVDWQLLNCSSCKQNKKNQQVKTPIGLRSRLLFHAAWYYIAMVLNFVLRCSWILIFVLRLVFGKQLDKYQWIFFLIILAGLFRRFVWNIFRLEVEQVMNIEEYRAVRVMPLPYASMSLKQDDSTTNHQSSTQQTRLEKLKRMFTFCELEALQRLISSLKVKSEKTHIQGAQKEFQIIEAQEMIVEMPSIQQENTGSTTSLL